jgi:CheY-like chemotaxis protein
VQREGRPTILVVEDEPMIREIVCDVLAEAPFDVICAGSTDAALEMLDHAPQIALAFLDVDLGDRGGGYVVARHARRIRPETVVIYTSGGAQESFDRERVAGSLFVPKPYRAAQIVALFEQVVLGQAA